MKHTLVELQCESEMLPGGFESRLHHYLQFLRKLSYHDG